MLNLALSLLVCAAPPEDDPAAELRAAVERLERSAGYAFEMRSEYHGGLGGVGSGRIGRPRGAVLGEVGAGRPVRLRFEGIELFRTTPERRVLRTDGGEWRAADRTPPARLRGPLSMLETLRTPDEILRCAVDGAREVSSSGSAAGSHRTWRVELSPEATKQLAGALARERRGASLRAGAPPREFEGKVVALVRAGKVEELDVEIMVRHASPVGDRFQRRAVSYLLRPPADPMPPVPEEVVALLGATPAADGEDSTSEENPAKAGRERKESGR